MIKCRISRGSEHRGKARGKPGARIRGLLRGGLAQKDLIPHRRNNADQVAQQRLRSRRWLGAGHRAPRPGVGPGSRPQKESRHSGSASRRARCRPGGSGSQLAAGSPAGSHSHAGGPGPTLYAGLSGNKESGLTSIKPSLV